MGYCFCIKEWSACDYSEISFELIAYSRINTAKCLGVSPDSDPVLFLRLFFGSKDSSINN